MDQFLSAALPLFPTHKAGVSEGLAKFLPSQAGGGFDFLELTQNQMDHLLFFLVAEPRLVRDSSSSFTSSRNFSFCS